MVHPAWLIAKTEIPLIFRSKYVKFSSIMVITLGIVMPVFILILPGLPLELYDLMIDIMVMPFILMVPAMLPVLISAESLVGERERRTLEPLLSTPLTTQELLLGKMLTALIPGLVILVITSISSFIVLNIGLLSIGVTGVVFPKIGHILLLAIDGPLLALAGINIMILVSSKVDTVYAAYQIGGIVVLPAFLPMMLTFMINDPTGITSFLITTLVVGGLNLGLFKFAVEMFDRDRMISRV